MSAEEILTEKLYTTASAAEALLLQPATVIRAIKEGKLQAYRVGRDYRITRAQLLAWIELSTAEAGE